MLIHQSLPTCTVKGQTMRGDDGFGLINMLMGDGRAEIFLNKGLQAKKHHIKIAFTRFDIAGQILTAFGVLHPVRGLVAVAV